MSLPSGVFKEAVLYNVFKDRSLIGQVVGLYGDEDPFNWKKAAANDSTVWIARWLWPWEFPGGGKHASKVV